MCGATDAQKGLEADQAAFFKTLDSNYSTVFGESQGILSTLRGGYQAVFDQGPNRHGFSAEENATLKTQAKETTATSYAHAKEALGEELASRGGDMAIGSGGDAELSAQLAERAAGEESSENNKIALADWGEGERQWEVAGQELGKTAETLNPVGSSSATTSAGTAAADTANQIAQADNSIWSSVIGGVSGIAGAATGGWITGLAKAKGGK